MVSVVTPGCAHGPRSPARPRLLRAGTRPARSPQATKPGALASAPSRRARGRAPARACRQTLAPAPPACRPRASSPGPAACAARVSAAGAAPPPASPDARPSLQRKDLTQHACSSPAIHDPKLASRKTAVVGTAGAAAKLGAHLRVVDLHLVVERVLAGVHVRRPHDVLRHRQPRRHGVRPQLCARRAGSARARAP